MNQAEREDAANEIRLLASVQVRKGRGVGGQAASAWLLQARLLS